MAGKQVAFWLSRSTDWLPSTMSGGSIVDIAFRRALLFSKLFTTSWGHPDILKELLLTKRAVTSQGGIQDFNNKYKSDIRIESEEVARGGERILGASFLSPYGVAHPSQMPTPVSVARMRVYLPKGEATSICIHLAATGDHSYGRREFFLVNDLLEKGIASVLLENPFYASRRPHSQFRSTLAHVSDLFVMGGALISECALVLEWAAQRGFQSFGISGVSMGAFMACLAASNAPLRLAVVPCLFATSAAATYTGGTLKNAIAWDRLDSQLRDRDYIRALQNIPHADWVDLMHEKNKENGEGLAINMMRVLMDEFTHLGGYPRPRDATLVHAILADQDAYIVQNGTPCLSELWPGCRVETIPAGHVTGYLLNHHFFRKAIIDSLDRARQKASS